MWHWDRPIILASTSPRRQELLAEVVDDFTIVPPNCDDGQFKTGTMSPTKWVRILAILKAQNVQQGCELASGTIVSADTVCVLGDEIYGQPQNADEAMVMITSMMETHHDVLTGWCLLSTDGSMLLSGTEKTNVHIGAFKGSKLEYHFDNNEWMGKAGGYNFIDCFRRGWPLTWHGDIENIMGLPVKKMKKLLGKKCSSI
jgi:septum formation protein